MPCPTTGGTRTKTGGACRIHTPACPALHLSGMHTHTPHGLQSAAAFLFASAAFLFASATGFGAAAIFTFGHAV